MSHDELSRLVEQLKVEIAALSTEDVETRERLQSLMTDLESRLATDDAGDGHEDLMDSLRDSIDRFEVEHPQATGLINQIMVMLGNMGI